MEKTWHTFTGGFRRPPPKLAKKCVYGGRRKEKDNGKNRLKEAKNRKEGGKRENSTNLAKIGTYIIGKILYPGDVLFSLPIRSRLLDAKLISKYV